MIWIRVMLTSALIRALVKQPRKETKNKFWGKNITFYNSKYKLHIFQNFFSTFGFLTRAFETLVNISL